MVTSVYEMDEFFVTENRRPGGAEYFTGTGCTGTIVLIGLQSMTKIRA